MILSKPAHTIVEEVRFDQPEFLPKIAHVFAQSRQFFVAGIRSSQSKRMDDYEKRIAKILEEICAPPRPKESKARIFLEASELVSVGLDIYGREQKLAPAAASAWHAMKTGAEQDGEALLLVSAFRSVDYQKQIIQRKRAAGQSWEQILRVSALPGYSEHHTGKTIDVSALGCKPLTEEFETTSAFAWLSRRAGEFRFTMTYPRGDPFGVDYEPWHWTFHEPL